MCTLLLLETLELRPDRVYLGRTLPSGTDLAALSGGFRRCEKSRVVGTLLDH